MKHVIKALGALLLPAVMLTACAQDVGSPWNRPATTAAPQQAEQAPNRLSPAQDPRLAYYRGLSTDGQTYPAQDGQVSGGGQDIAFPYGGAMASGAPDVAVKVALLVPLSGAQAELGQAMLNAAQQALFDMGYQSFELMPRDTGMSTEGARSAAQSALDDGAQLILGPIFADAARAVKPVAAQRGVNVVTFSTDWTLAGGNMYVMGFLPFGQVQRIAEYTQSRGLQRVGILAPDNAYGNAVVNAYQSTARALGAPQPAVTRFPAEQQNIADIVKNFARYDQRMGHLAPRLKPLEERLRVNPRDADAQAQIAAIKREAQAALPYDAVLLPVGGARATSIAGLLRYYDMDHDNVRLLGTGLWDDTALARDPALRGAWFAAPQPDLRSGFERNYRANYGGMAPPRLATLAYDATALAVVLARTGVRRGGQPSFDHATITNPNGFAGIDGIFRFRPDGLVERGHAVLTFRDMGVHMIDRAPNTFQQHDALMQGGM